MNKYSLEGLTNAEIAQLNRTPEEVWSAAYERIVKCITTFKTYRRTPILTIQPDDLPCLSVYLLRDREQPLGDSNVLEPRFKQFVHLGISGMIAASDVDIQLQWLANNIQATRLALYTDPGFIELISGFESSDTKLVFSRISETPVAEYQMELVLSFETYWPPLVEDDFKTLHVTVRYPTPDSKAPPIERHWTIEQ